MPVVEIKDLSKKYDLYPSAFARFKEVLLPGKKKYHTEHPVLKNISFSMEEGDILGIVGKNGCGKSTLLKIIAGVLTQSSGLCSVNGRISALLELGSGFNPEYTGIENIYFSGSLMGFTNKQIDDRLEEIIAFADIGDYIHQPIKTYSSGMSIRLAFSVAVNIEPDILIIDEALSVGDIRFQQKSIRKMKDLMDKAKAIIFVTHDIGSVLNFCNRAIWLKDGQIFQEGHPSEVCKDYVSYMSHNKIASTQDSQSDFDLESIPDSTEHKCHIDEISTGTQFAQIKGWCFNNETSQPVEQLKLAFNFGKESLIFETETILRPDVAEVFSNKNLGSCGFSALIPTRAIHDKTGELVLLVKNESQNFKKIHLKTLSAEPLDQNSQEQHLFSTDNYARFGNADAIIKAVTLREVSTGAQTSLIKGGELLDYIIELHSSKEIESPIVGIIIKDRHGNDLIGINSFIYNLPIEPIAANSVVRYSIRFEMPFLSEGVYTISPALSDGTQMEHTIIDWVHDATIFEIRTNDLRQKIGVFVAPQNVSFQTLQL